MDISIYFEPVDVDLLLQHEPSPSGKLGSVIEAHTAETGFPDTTGVAIAILGVNEDRAAANNRGTALSANATRSFLYNLYPGAWSSRIADLGNIRQGHTIEDTYFALTSSLELLIANKVLPIIIGGGQDLTFAVYNAYAKMGRIINMAVADPRFDLGDTSGALTSVSYLSRIIMQKPNFLFNYTNLGYQTYFVDQPALELMKKLLFDTYRLGHLRSQLHDCEPLLRNADLVSFDMGAIRAADAPGNGNASPNGFTGDEACQLARYAGMSDKLSSIGFFEYNPGLDRHEITAHLQAQMIWYVIEGYNLRKNDFPVTDNDSYIRYIVPTPDFSDGIVFIKSRKTDRWWMEIVCRPENRSKYENHYIVPCSYADYQTACNNELPDRWWQMYQKLM